jgi:hypothetical protein
MKLSNGQEITIKPAVGENAFRLMAIYSRYFPEMMNSGDNEDENMKQMMAVFATFSDEKITNLFKSLKVLFTGCVVELDQVIQNDQVITNFEDTMAILGACQESEKKDQETAGN